MASEVLRGPRHSYALRPGSGDAVPVSQMPWRPEAPHHDDADALPPGDAMATPHQPRRNPDPLPDYRPTLRYLAAVHGLLDWAPRGSGVPRREHIKGLVLKVPPGGSK